MKILLGSLSAISFLAVGQLRAADTGSTSTPQTVEHGVESVKEGTKEAARGLSAAAEEAGKNAAEVTKKVGQSIKAATCPVVGDRKSKLYYAADSKSYLQVLDGQKYFEDDDRSCFRTEDAARADGYVRSAN